MRSYLAVASDVGTRLMKKSPRLHAPQQNVQFLLFKQVPSGKGKEIDCVWAVCNACPIVR